MTSGGARAQSGPPRDPNALRRDRPSDKGDWTHLPAAGRAEPAPDWPLTRATAREAVHWIREWGRPQALMWERLELGVEVALYVRTLADAEKTKAPVNVRTLVKQQQQALGLSIPGLAYNRWVIDPTPAEQVTQPDDDDRTSAKTRFRSITGGAAS